MDLLLFSAAWVSELRSDALILTVVVVAVVGYIALTSGSYSDKKRRGTNRSSDVRFVKIFQENRTAAQRESAIVIGGSGYLGKRLIKHLVNEDRYHVHALDLTIPPADKRDPNISSYIQTDITNRDHMIRALRGMTVVFHTASIIPMTVDITDEDMQRVNVEGTRNVIEACKANNVKRLIYTSSSSVPLGKDPSQVCENVDEYQKLPDDPLNAYVRTKGKAETMVINTNREGELRTCALRLAGLLGGRDNKLMQSFMAACVIQFCAGKSRISWIGVDSAANAHVVAENKLRENEEDIAGKVFNISMRDKFEIGELYHFFAEENGRPLIILPTWIVKSLVSFNVYTYNKTGIVPLYAYMTPACFEFLQNDFTVSTERARKVLGWEESRPWKELVRELIKDFKAESKCKS